MGRFSHHLVKVTSSPYDPHILTDVCWSQSISARTPESVVSKLDWKNHKTVKSQLVLSVSVWMF